MALSTINNEEKDMLHRLKTLSYTTIPAALLLSLGMAYAAPSIPSKTNLQNYAASLSAEQGIKGNPASTQAKLTYFPANHSLKFNIPYAKLTGSVTKAHFHLGSVKGSVIKTICGEPAPGILGQCPAGTNGSLTGTWVVPAGQAATFANELAAGQVYINVHTAKNPGGEIGGQITKD